MDPAKSILDEWRENDMQAKDTAKSYPILKTLGSGSDYAHFTFYAGVPSMDIWFRKDQTQHKGSYAAYHTGYDTYFNVANNTDPGFKIIQGDSLIDDLSWKY